MKYNNINNISTDDREDEKYNCNFKGDVNFIMGPLSIYQFNKFAELRFMRSKIISIHKN